MLSILKGFMYLIRTCKIDTILVLYGKLQLKYFYVWISLDYPQYLNELLELATRFSKIKTGKFNDLVEKCFLWRQNN